MLKEEKPRSKEIKNKNNFMDNISKNFRDWHDILNEFRETDEYKKSKGIGLMPKFFTWLCDNYEIPKKIKKY